MLSRPISSRDFGTELSRIRTYDSFRFPPVRPIRSIVLQLQAALRILERAIAELTAIALALTLINVRGI